MSDTEPSQSEQPPESESTTAKGARHENEARTILSRIYGGSVSKVNKVQGSHDPFGFVDLIALDADEPVLFVQVKTNRFTASDKRKYNFATRNLPHDHARFQVWVRHDRKGWEVYEYDGDEFGHHLSIDSCDTTAARGKYALSRGRELMQKEKDTLE